MFQICLSGAPVAFLGSSVPGGARAPNGQEDDAWLILDIVGLGRQFGRYHYRCISAVLRRAGWLVAWPASGAVSPAAPGVWATLASGNTKG